MYNRDTEIIFPFRVLPVLSRLRGETWQALVDDVQRDQAPSPKRQAFILLMVQLNGCLTCDWEAYRAQQGCTECSQGALRRFRGDDQELLAMYHEAREIIEKARVGKRHHKND